MLRTHCADRNCGSEQAGDLPKATCREGADPSPGPTRPKLLLAHQNPMILIMNCNPASLDHTCSLDHIYPIDFFPYSLFPYKDAHGIITPKKLLAISSW